MMLTHRRAMRSTGKDESCTASSPVHTAATPSSPPYHVEDLRCALPHIHVRRSRREDAAELAALMRSHRKSPPDGVPSADTFHVSSECDFADLIETACISLTAVATQRANAVVGFAAFDREPLAHSNSHSGTHTSSVSTAAHSAVPSHEHSMSVCQKCSWESMLACGSPWQWKSESERGVALPFEPTRAGGHHDSSHNNSNNGVNELSEFTAYNTLWLVMLLSPPSAVRHSDECVISMYQSDDLARELMRIAFGLAPTIQYALYAQTTPVLSTQRIPQPQQRLHSRMELSEKGEGGGDDGGESDPIAPRTMGRFALLHRIAVAAHASPSSSSNTLLPSSSMASMMARATGKHHHHNGNSSHSRNIKDNDTAQHATHARNDALVPPVLHVLMRQRLVSPLSLRRGRVEDYDDCVRLLIAGRGIITALPEQFFLEELLQSQDDAHKVVIAEDAARHYVVGLATLSTLCPEQQRALSQHYDTTAVENWSVRDWQPEVAKARSDAAAGEGETTSYTHSSNTFSIDFCYFNPDYDACVGDFVQFMFDQFLTCEYATMTAPHDMDEPPLMHSFQFVPPLPGVPSAPWGTASSVRRRSSASDSHRDDAEEQRRSTHTKDARESGMDSGHANHCTTGHVRHDSAPSATGSEGAAADVMQWEHGLWVCCRYALQTMTVSPVCSGKESMEVEEFCRNGAYALSVKRQTQLSRDVRAVLNSSSSGGATNDAPMRQRQQQGSQQQVVNDTSTSSNGSSSSSIHMTTRVAKVQGEGEATGGADRGGVQSALQHNEPRSDSSSPLSTHSHKHTSPGDTGVFALRWRGSQLIGVGSCRRLSLSDLYTLRAYFDMDRYICFHARTGHNYAATDIQLDAQAGRCKFRRTSVRGVTVGVLHILPAFALMRRFLLSEMLRWMGVRVAVMWSYPSSQERAAGGWEAEMLPVLPRRVIESQHFVNASMYDEDGDGSTMHCAHKAGNRGNDVNDCWSKSGDVSSSRVTVVCGSSSKSSSRERHGRGVNDPYNVMTCLTAEQRGGVLFLTTPRALCDRKRHIHTRLVLVGAGATALCCLYRLLTVPYLLFTQVVLVSTDGMPEWSEQDCAKHDTQQQQHSLCLHEMYSSRMELRRREYNRLRVGQSVRVVSDTMIDLDRTRQLVLLRHGGQERYDYLVLTTGRQYVIPRRLRRLLLAELGDGHTGANHTSAAVVTANTTTATRTPLAISSPWSHAAPTEGMHCVVAIDGVSSMRQLQSQLRALDGEAQGTSNVLIYGSSLDAFAAVTAVLSSGLSAQRIVLCRREQAVSYMDAACLSCALALLRELGVTVMSGFDVSRVEVDEEGELRRVLLAAQPPRRPTHSPPQHTNGKDIFASLSPAAAAAGQESAAAALREEGAVEEEYVENAQHGSLAKLSSPRFRPEQPIPSKTPYGPADHKQSSPASALAAAAAPVSFPTSSEVELSCALVVAMAEKDITAEVLQTMNRRSIVLDGRVIVENNYVATDPQVYAAGPVAMFTRRYGATAQFEEFNARDVGSHVAHVLLARMHVDEFVDASTSSRATTTSHSANNNNNNNKDDTTASALYSKVLEENGSRRARRRAGAALRSEDRHRSKAGHHALSSEETWNVLHRLPRYSRPRLRRVHFPARCLFFSAVAVGFDAGACERLEGGYFDAEEMIAAASRQSFASGDGTTHNANAREGSDNSSNTSMAASGKTNLAAKNSASSLVHEPHIISIYINNSTGYIDAIMYFGTDRPELDNYAALIGLPESLLQLRYRYHAAPKQDAAIIAGCHASGTDEAQSGSTPPISNTVLTTAMWHGRLDLVNYLRLPHLQLFFNDRFIDFFAQLQERMKAHNEAEALRALVREKHVMDWALDATTRARYVAKLTDAETEFKYTVQLELLRFLHENKDMMPQQLYLPSLEHLTIQ